MNLLTDYFLSAARNARREGENKTKRETVLHALVAQLDRVSASDAEGCGFDSRRVHHVETRRILQ